MGKKKFSIVILILLLVFSLLFQPAGALADDLVIQDDGNVVLIISNSGVLGVSTLAANEPIKPTVPASQTNSPQEQNASPQHSEQRQQSPPPPPTVPQPQVKIEPLVPPHTESIVQINPPATNDKKVQVIITTQTVQQISTPAPFMNPPTATAISTHHETAQQDHQSATNPVITVSPTSSRLPATPTAPALRTQQTAFSTPTPPSATNHKEVVTRQIVNRVVAQGANGEPVITIKSDRAAQLTIQQGATQVTTSLPLQIDTITHILSVPLPNESARVSVLPTEALQGIMNMGLLNTRNVSQAQINLTNDENGIAYTVKSQKQGKLFGIFSVQSPVQIKLSAQNGKVVKTSQSLLFNIFGGLIR